MDKTGDLERMVTLLLNDLADAPVGEGPRVSAEARGENAVVIHVLGNAVGHATHELFDRIFNRIRTLSCHLVVDLKKCHHISSYALGLLAALAADRRDHRWLLYVTGADKRIDFSIHSLGLDPLIRERDTVDDALAEIDRLDG